MSIEQPFGVDDSNLVEKWPELVAISEKNNSIKNSNELLKTIELTQNSLFKNRPVLGAQRWFITEIVQLPENYIGVRMEDGHIENYALIKHEIDLDKLITIVETQY